MCTHYVRLSAQVVELQGTTDEAGGTKLVAAMGRVIRGSRKADQHDD